MPPRRPGRAASDSTQNAPQAPAHAENPRGRGTARSPQKRRTKKTRAPPRPASPEAYEDRDGRSSPEYEYFDLNVSEGPPSDDSGGQDARRGGRRRIQPQSRSAAPESNDQGSPVPLDVFRVFDASPTPASNADSTVSVSKTQDVNFFFIRGDKKTGTKSICWKCRDAYLADPRTNPNKNKPVFEYAATTGISGLRAHLEANHKQEYLDTCREQGWARIMLPKLAKVAASAQDDTRNAENSQTPYSIQALHEKLVNFIVVDDQSLNVIECPEFRQLLLLLRDDLHDKNVPRRTHLRALIIKAWRVYFQRLKDDLEKSLGNISFTADIWSDKCLRPYFAITGHWIARNEETRQLELKSTLLAFHRVVGKHDGKNLAQIALSMLDHAGITVKAGHWTLDNAENNATFMRELEILLKARDIKFDNLDNRIMCFPHIINIAVQHVIEDFTNLDLADLAHDYKNSLSPNDPARKEYERLRARDPVALGRDIVRVLRASGQRRDAFDTIIRLSNENGWFGTDKDGKPRQLGNLQLLRDVKTRWDSVYYMICRLRDLRPAIDHYFSLPTNKDVAGYKLSDSEWRALQDFEMILAIPHQVQQVMSGEKTPILAGAIPCFEAFMFSWELLGERHARLKQSTDIGLEWAAKYYSRMDNTRAYVVAMFINPDIRLDWINEHWEGHYIVDAVAKIKSLMYEYRNSRRSTIAAPAIRTPSSTGDSSYRNIAQQYGLPPGIIGRSAGTVPSRNRGQSVDDEYNSYLSAPRPSNDIPTDLLQFWGTYGRTWPTIFAIAMDYLPIQAAAVPSERVFSSSAETDTKRRNRIKPELMEALQMLKFALKKDRLDFTAGWKTSGAQLVGDRPSEGDLLGELLREGSGPASAALLSNLCEDEIEVEDQDEVQEQTVDQDSDENQACDANEDDDIPDKEMPNLEMV